MGASPGLRRVVTRADRLVAVELALEYGRWAAQVAKSEYGVDAESETEEGLSTSLDELLAPPASLYLAELDGSAVGLGGVKSVTPDVAEIKRMYVRPSARGRGIGRALLARLVEDARALGARSVRLESAGFMVEAHTLYRSFGFAAIEPFAGRDSRTCPAPRRSRCSWR